MFLVPLSFRIDQVIIPIFWDGKDILFWGGGENMPRYKEGEEREIGTRAEVGGKRDGGWWRFFSPMRRE